MTNITGSDLFVWDSKHRKLKWFESIFILAKKHLYTSKIYKIYQQSTPTTATILYKKIFFCCFAFSFRHTGGSCFDNWQMFWLCFNSNWIFLAKFNQIFEQNPMMIISFDWIIGPLNVDYWCQSLVLIFCCICFDAPINFRLSQFKPVFTITIYSLFR